MAFRRRRGRGRFRGRRVRGRRRFSSRRRMRGMRRGLLRIGYRM